MLVIGQEPPFFISIFIIIIIIIIMKGMAILFLEK